MTTHAENDALKRARARVGTNLNAKWRIDRMIGVGGMGVVYAVTHLNNRSTAAAKLLHVEYARAEDIRSRFLREGRIANRVDHPGRVKVTDDDVSDLGEPFLLMELLIGRTLSEALRSSPQDYPLEKLLKVFDPVLDLLGKCHEIGIIHRDIKPANIFLPDEGTVRVLDFGVARMREPDAGLQATRVGVALGTASFIAPEQALGVQEIDARADVFSVGACLYAAVTGVRLHAAKTEAEEFVLAATKAAPSVARTAPDLPAPVVAFIDKALAYDKVKRFQNAAQMRVELLALIEGLKTGRVAKGGGKATGIVVRGHDVIEEGDAPGSEIEKRKGADRMLGIFKQLGLAMANVRQYGFSHPQTTRALGQAFADIATSLKDDPHSVRWEVSAGAFTWQGIPIWEPDRVPFDRIPHQLFADGIRKVQFKPGITEQELTDFLAILIRELSEVFSAEDDSVTALWDRRFEHIAYLAVDSWAGGEEDQAGSVERAEWENFADSVLSTASIDKDFDDTSLEAQAEELNIANALKQAGEAAAAYAVDPMTRATLGAQVGLSSARWRDAYVDAFVPAYLEGRANGDLSRLHISLAEWTLDQVRLRGADVAFEMHATLSQGFRTHLDSSDALAVELEMATIMFPVDVLREIMADFARDRRGGDGEKAEIRPALISGLGRALELMASDAVYGLAGECLDTGDTPELRNVLLPYLRRWAKGKEPVLGEMLPRVGPTTAQDFIAILTELSTHAALSAIEKAFDSPHLPIRLLALAKLGEGAVERVREELGILLDDPDPAVRRETLALIVSLGVVAAGPLLVVRLQSDAFHTLPVDERKVWLEAVAALNAARAEAVVIELLNTRPIISTEATDQTRSIAAEFLARASSADAVIALEETSKQRWRTSASVRQAALSALEIIKERQKGSGTSSEAGRG